MNMKKGILTLLLALMAVCSAWAGTPERIGDIVRQYRNREGFEVMTMGRFLLGTLRAAARLDSDVDQEDRAALEALKGIKKMTLVDFEDASQADKTQFCLQVEKVLDKLDLIMEAKDGGEPLRIYGLEDGDKLKDIILYRADGALISISGSIGLEHIGELMDTSK